MTRKTGVKPIQLSTAPWPWGQPSVAYPGLRWLQQKTRGILFHQLNQALKHARPLPFDDHSKIIFLSDAHRGGGGRSDAFAANEPLFLHALNRYFEEGYTYIEVGDGDELWKNSSIDVIRRAHPAVFELLHAFLDRGRLQMITGNHDTRDRFRLNFSKAGIPTQEALFLHHRDRSQGLFVVHGHQADFSSSLLHTLSRFCVEYVLTGSQRWGWVGTAEKPAIDRHAQRQRAGRAWMSYRPTTERVEDRLLEWVQQRRIPTICGHTHAPFFARRAQMPYFNTGSCIFEDAMTGLELEGGALRQIRWRQEKQNGRITYVREVMSAAVPLARLNQP